MSGAGLGACAWEGKGGSDPRLADKDGSTPAEICSDKAAKELLERCSQVPSLLRSTAHLLVWRLDRGGQPTAALWLVPACVCHDACYHACGTDAPPSLRWC